MNLNSMVIREIFEDPPHLMTDRLMLRKMIKADAHDMYEYSRRGDVTEYLLWDPHTSEEYTRRYLTYIQSRYRNGEFYDWAIVLKSTYKMIGTCGFTKISTETNSAEIGYVLNPDYWGKGIAAEAATRVLRFGFDTLGLHRIEARYMLGNDKSRRVMEKIGMSFEGVHRESMYVKDNYVSVGTCAILKREYYENHPRMIEDWKRNR